MCAAVRSLSPEIIHTSMPRCCSCFTTGRASGLSESATANAPARSSVGGPSSASATAALLPVPSTAATSSAAAADPTTVARPASRLTVAEATPSTARSASSTRALQ